MDASRARLVGRDDEVALLARLVGGRQRRRAHFLAVSGEPGIGKTRLLAELGVIAGERRWLVLEGRGTEFERELPFAVLADALDDYVGSLPPRVLAPLGAERLSELARALPTLADYRAGPALVAERYRLHRAIRALLELLAARSAVVLVLDDVQWADRASLEALLHVLRHPPAAQVLIALGFRSAQVDPELSAQLSAAAVEGDATLLTVTPLSEAQTGEIAGIAMDRDRVRELYVQSGGNPFYALQLVRSPASDDPAITSVGLELDAPPAVVAAIERELAAASEPARRLLAGAAVAGDPFEIELAAWAGDVGGGAARALDELRRLELVHPTAVPTQFRFRHPIVRAAVYEVSGPGWRIEAHARAAAELERRGAAAVERAHHIEHSAQPGDEAAIAVLQNAATAVSMRAPATAARWLEAALRLLPGGQRERRLELLVTLARALVPAARPEDARARVLEALDLLPPEAAGARVRLTALCAAFERWSGHGDEAQARLEAARERLPQEAVAEAVELDLQLIGGVVWGQPERRDAARRALRAADRLEDAALRAEALATVAAHEAYFTRSSRAQTDAAALYDALPDDVLATRHGFASTWLAHAEIWLDHYQDALRHLERGVGFARASGDSRSLMLMLAQLGFGLTVVGRATDGRRVAADAVEAARLSGARQFLSIALYMLGMTALEAGDIPTAKSAFEEGRAASVPGHRFELNCDVGRAEVLLEQGDPERARRLALDCGGLAVSGLGQRVAHCAGVLIRACIELGRLDEALAHAELARGVTACQLPVTGAPVARAHAALLLAEDSAAEAAEVARSAAARAAAAGAQIQGARSLVVAGRALAAAGNRHEALTVLGDAHSALDACGAGAWCDEAARELRRLGRHIARRGRRGGGAGLGALSGRELEVAELVAEGRTNREISAALFVSEKTVEKHLARVFEKLGVSGRRAVGWRLAEERQQQK